MTGEKIEAARETAGDSVAEGAVAANMENPGKTTLRSAKTPPTKRKKA